eukprot:9895521-Karenia_brevis.AAC.1
MNTPRSESLQIEEHTAGRKVNCRPQVGMWQLARSHLISTVLASGAGACTCFRLTGNGPADLAAGRASDKKWHNLKNMLPTSSSV